ncbi:MAG: (Fe-S)-binding protein [Proteobacteria bacterium]|nr:(Fe-S)-binding protein [Pseudomonadota bacterium]
MPANVKAGSTAEARIAALADVCVKCGLCLPHCPTYRLAASEAESPRGRIAFAQALAQGKLEPSASVLAHLDNCLACMACERVCPSQVQYGKLITTTRAWLRDTGKIPAGARMPGRLVAHPRLLGALLRAANLPGLRQLLQSRAIGALLRPFGLARMLAELPRLPRIESAAIPATVSARGKVGLFPGCIAASADRDVHLAARRLLVALGYEVVVPAAQGCCGALALHSGDAAQADHLAQALRAAFADSRIDTLLVSASGCFGTLRHHVFSGSKIRVREIHEFLAADDAIDTLTFRPLAERMAVHTPCTQRNVARADGAIARLLARIPLLRIDALPAPPGCCGAAGDYFLRHPDIADSLRTQTLDVACACDPQQLITSNVGCRIFLDNGLRQRAAQVAVTHPIVLLAQQLEN